MIDINKSGGPAWPTLSGGALRDGSYRWEGACLFDSYFMSALQSGKDVDSAFDIAVQAMKMRNDHIIVEDAQSE